MLESSRHSMRVRFWGTRGSIASPGSRTSRYGGNTSCVEIRSADGTLIVLDCGTGVRELGLRLMRSEPRPVRINLFIGHTHWDHIQGFPFFAPAFVPGAEVNIYAPLGFQRSLEEAMAGQMESSYFPVKLRDLHSRIHFTELDEGFFRVGDVLVETQYLNHTAPTIAYRMTSGDAIVAYVTDHEPFWKPTGNGFQHPGDQRHVAFLRGAHLIIHDAQYTPEEYEGKVGWGHSPIDYAADVAMAAGVQRLALFHHDPIHDDQAMERIEAAARARVAGRGGAVEVFAAAEGLELEVKGGGLVLPVAEGSALRRVPMAGRRVLVVTADRAEIGSIERELAEDGLVVESVSGVESALEKIAGIAPDVVILSGRPSDGAGAAGIGPLRAALRRPEVPVLLLTDEPPPGSPHEALPTDYLVRPFSPPMLRSRVRAWLSRTLVREPPGPDTDLPEPRPSFAGAGTIAQYADMLMTMDLFRSLGREELETLAVHALDQLYPVGHEIVREGSPAESLFVILSGRVRVSEIGRDAPSDLIIAELGPGQVFGELGVLRGQPRVADVIAIERTHCLVLPSANFLQAVRTLPGLALALLKVLAARLSDADRRLAHYAPDPLTGLMRRRAFVDQYRRLAAGARRRGAGLFLITFDVRHLKAINDRFGYAAGDEVLRGVADTLLEATRSSDLVTRYGGDEFAVLFEDRRSGHIEFVVDRLRNQLVDAGRRRDVATPVDCAVGVAFSPNPPEGPDELFQAADADMRVRARAASARHPTTDRT
jgi:diguanylate cyclase (GGDEF)-like protein